MISGWSSLQLPRADSHGRGAFSPPLPSIASRPSSREQSLFLCRSCGDRSGVDGLSNVELKVTLVENLVGAFINVTEILDGYTQPSGVPSVVKQLLGFETSNQYQDLALASHPLAQSESLELLFHERLSHGSSAHSSSSFRDNVVSMSLSSQRHSHADGAIRSSSALHVGSLSQGQQNLPVNPIRPADGCGKFHNLSLEEDSLLQEARSKAFRRRMEPNEVKDAHRAEIFGDGLVDGAFTDSKQANASNGLVSRKEVCVETEKAWSLAEIRILSLQSSLFWGSIALSMLLTAYFIVTCRSIFFKGRPLQRPTVKRRILKSQWYGNSGSPVWEHKNFQMKVSEFPKYPLLEVDGDRKLLRFPSVIAGATASGRESQAIIRAQTPQKQHIRQSIHDARIGYISSANKAQGQPIRQTIHSSRKEHGSKKAQQDKSLNGGVSAEQLPETVAGLQTTPEEERETVGSQSRGLGFHKTRIQNVTQEEKPEQRFSRMNSSKSRTSQGQWGKDDELDLDQRIQRLYHTIQAVEQHRRATMIALEEERQRSLALEQEMFKQREAAALLGEEVRLLKESHDALLTSLRKKYSSSAAARTAADLVYQDWERRVAAE
ncbi:hypothetical protein L7F22_034428 [Adiantum nelumboides]|nr:hypothetical protein [Adiantum nelumboides]